MLALFGLLAMAVLLCSRVSGGILIGVAATWLPALVTRTFVWQPQPYNFRDIAATA